MSAAFRSERIQVTRRIKNGFLTLAHLAGAEHEHDLAQAEQTSDALICAVLDGYLDARPEVVEQEKAIHKAIRSIKKDFEWA